MLKRFNPEKLQEFQVEEEGKEQSCLIPVEGREAFRLHLEVRSPLSVDVNVVNLDGQTVLLESGKIVRYSGRMEGITAVEIVAKCSFWYSCQKSGSWFELVDPVPMQVELVQTEKDILASMIEDRLRRFKHQMNMDRELSDDEKDDLILDIARGDLEFEEAPDEFGLGYEERLAEFTRRSAEQAEPAPEPAPKPGAGGQPNPAPEGGNSSST